MLKVIDAESLTEFFFFFLGGGWEDWYIHSIFTRNIIYTCLTGQNRDNLQLCLIIKGYLARLVNNTRLNVYSNLWWYPSWDFAYRLHDSLQGFVHK